MGKLKKLFCKHKEKEEFESDWVKYHWVDENSVAKNRADDTIPVTYELREGQNIQKTCKLCGKKWIHTKTRVLDIGLTDFSLFGKVRI